MQRRPPPLHKIDRIDFPVPEILDLTNGMKVYLMQGGSQEVCKIDMMFDAGRPYEKMQLAAITTGRLMKEGTQSKEADLIAEMIDQRGATISAPHSFDHINLQLVCLTRHVDYLLPLLVEIVREPAFREKELQLFKKRTRQRLIEDLSRNDVIAFRQATELYFGPTHPYGYNSDTAGYDALQRNDLLEHHGRLFGPQTGVVFVAGNIPKDFLRALDSLMSDWHQEPSGASAILPDAFPLPTRWESDMKKSQSAIRVGRRLFNRNHEDWPKLVLLNTLLGGYFGSRLMKNLREDKGITYGVQSSLESFKYGGYFNVSLETERQYVPLAEDNIWLEIRKMQQDLVSEREFSMAKNYVGGYLLSLMDGPLQAIEVLKGNLAEGSNVDFIGRLLDQLQEISREHLRSVAQKYLMKADLSHVVVH